MMFRLPLMITCAQFEEFITDYLDGNLSPKQKFVFELHLMVCRECREFLRAYKASMDLAKDVLKDENMFSTTDVPEDLIKAVLAARSEK